MIEDGVEWRKMWIERWKSGWVRSLTWHEFVVV